MEPPFHEVSQNEATPKSSKSIVRFSIETYGDDWGSTILGNPHWRGFAEDDLAYFLHEKSTTTGESIENIFFWWFLKQIHVYRYIYIIYIYILYP